MLIKKFEKTLQYEDHWDYRGTSNSERDYVHGFCTYPAMMVPKMQREMLSICLEELTVQRPRLIDPFAGSGTILVEGMLRGLDVLGVDINPLAVLLCKVKTTILEVRILEKESWLLKTNISRSNDVEDFYFKGIEKWFTPKAIADLSRIRAAIVIEENIKIRRFFWATFCEVIRIVSNSRDCTYKLHIKDIRDIKAYDKDAVSIFLETLDYNIKKYKEFHTTMEERGLIKKNGLYKGDVKIIMGDSITFLRKTKRKFDLLFTSPPYGDNHTTVSYGQYSVLSLRWMNWTDIDDSVNEKLLETLYEIDNISLGGMSSNKYLTQSKRDVVNKSATLSKQVNMITCAAPKQVNKLVAFYSDMDGFLEALSQKVKPAAVSVWTLGNRKVGKQEIYMNTIITELGKRYGLDLLTSFSRKILNKRMPKINAYKGEHDDLIETMTREHILIFIRSEQNDGSILAI